MDECREEWIEHHSRRHADGDGIYNQCAVEVLEDDGPVSPGNANRLYEFLKVVSNQDVCAFASDIRARAHVESHDS